MTEPRARDERMIRTLEMMAGDESEERIGTTREIPSHSTNWRAKTSIEAQRIVRRSVSDRVGVRSYGWGFRVIDMFN